MSKRENKLQKNNERTLMEAYFLNGSNDCCNGSTSGNGTMPSGPVGPCGPLPPSPYGPRRI